MGDGTKENPYTHEDVLRLIEENGGKAEGLDLSGKVFEEGIDLSRLDLNGIVLKGGDLIYAHLFGANLDRADLRGADLKKAHLQRAHLEKATLLGTHLEEADLTEAELGEANLTDAHLEKADLTAAHLEKASLPTGAHLEKATLLGTHLEEADLRGAYLEGACLIDANLKEAELGHAKLDKADLRFAHLEGADLIGVEFLRDTKLDDVYWGDYALYREKSGEFGSVISTYRGLKTWYTQHGIYDVAGEFFYREMEAKRKSQSWKKEPASKLWSWVMRLLCGYGEKPWRVVVSGISVLFGSALLYFLLRGVAPYALTVEAFSSSLYYSAVSFTALGYGPWFSASSVRSWVQGVGAAEAIVGVFMIALFLVTFTRKMTR